MKLTQITKITHITKGVFLGGFLKATKDYIARVLADSGLVVDKNSTNDIYKNLPQQDSILFGWVGVAGSKKRTSTIWSYFTKLHNMFGSNDATQTTEALQPYVSGNIAPNENEGFKNVNGGGRYMTHPTISFAANEEWSFTTVLNFYANSSGSISYFSSSGLSSIGIQINYTFRISNDDGISLYSSVYKEIIGKNNIITFIGDGNGHIDIYINGIFKQTVNISSKFSFSLTGSNTISATFIGKTNARFIWNKALSAPEIAQVATTMQKYYPEIPAVTIGTQTWATSNFEAVATPMGTVIHEMQAASAVENITVAADRDFSSDTGWWTKNGTNTTISGTLSVINADTASNGISRGGMITLGKWYKVTYTINSISSGGVYPRVGSSGTLAARTTAGTYNDYILCSGDTVFRFYGSQVGQSFAIDNLSIKELGWADSQELYNGLIAQGSSVYDATKAAAMWCYYNNDLPTGAIYGKLYNWFAVSLLQQDIDLYNAANPTAHWGWHVPSNAEFTTLQTALGGKDVAGGKMKVAGTNYWTTPNTGADNSSGFSIVGSGLRYTDGSTSSMLASSVIWGIDDVIGASYSNTSSAPPAGFLKVRGYSIRLIKD